jgi:hypothetical protein
VARKLFDKSSRQPRLQHIPEGCADIARALGLNPKDTYWDYAVVYAPESGQNLTDRSAGIVEEGITTLIRGDANGLTLKLPEGFLAYQKKYAGVTNVLEVTDKPIESNEFHYPEHSVHYQLARKVEKSPRLRDVFNEKSFCSLMPSPDIEASVAQIGGKTLITSEQAVKFNSKVRVLRDAAANEYNVSPFVVAETMDALEDKFAEISQTARDLGLDPQKTKFWVKFDNLAGGMGVMPYEPAKTRFEEVKAWIRNVLQEARIPEEKFVPVIMDIDVGALPEVKRVLTNMNVQAIVGPQGVTVTGVTFQKTADGHYIGGVLPLAAEEKAYAAEGPAWALPVLEAAGQQGYRGYAGIDIILCEEKSGKIRGYVLEMNGRINSSTSLLSMAHWVEEQSGIPDVPACNLSSSFRPLQDFSSFRKAFNSVLYKGAASGYTGIVPIILKPDESGKINGVKAIAVAPDAASLARLEKRFDAIVRKLSS